MSIAQNGLLRLTTGHAGVEPEFCCFDVSMAQNGHWLTWFSVELHLIGIDMKSLELEECVCQTVVRTVYVCDDLVCFCYESHACDVVPVHVEVIVG